MALVIDDTLISNVADNLRAAMTTDPNMRKAIQQHIREALWEARKEMINSVNFKCSTNICHTLNARNVVVGLLYELILKNGILRFSW